MCELVFELQSNISNIGENTIPKLLLVYIATVTDIRLEMRIIQKYQISYQKSNFTKQKTNRGARQSA